MPTPSYEELSDAPAYDELSDAPAYGELSDTPEPRAPTLYDLRAAEFDDQVAPEKPFRAPANLREVIQEGIEPDVPRVSQVGIRNAIDFGTKYVPNILTVAERLIPGGKEFAEGVRGSAAEMAAGMTTPKSAAIAPAFAVPVLGEALAMKMGAEALGAGAGRSYAALEQGNPRELGAGLVETAGGAAMAIPGAMSALNRLPTRAGESLPVSDIPNPDVVARNAIIEGAQQTAVDTGLHRTAAALEAVKKSVESVAKEPVAIDQVQQLETPIEASVSLADQVYAMKPDEFVKWARAQEGGYTNTAYKLGETMNSPEGAAKLRELEAKTEIERQAAFEAEDIEAAMTLANKKQFLTEALESAVGVARNKANLTPEQVAKAKAAPVESPIEPISEAQSKQNTEAFKDFTTPQKSKELESDLRKEGWNVSGVSVGDRLFDHAEIHYRGKKVSEADTAAEAWKKIMDGEISPPKEPTQYEQFVKSEIDKRTTAAEPVTSGALGVEGLSPAGVSEPLSTGSQLAQLTEVIKTRKPSPNASISTRIGDAVKTVSSEWAKGKDAVTAGLGKLKAVSTALADSYANLPPWKDFEDAVGKWSGADNASGVEVRSFQQAVNKSVPSKLRQEAITNWIQADGDPAVLKSRAAASKPDVRAGYEEALKLTPDEQVLARNIGQYLESRLQEGIDTGLLKNGVDNYVTQVWKKENPVTNKLQSDLFGGGNLNPNFKYARQRVFDSYFEGEQAGFKPQNKNIGALIAHYDAAFNKSLASRSFIKALHEGTTPDGDPIVEVSGKTIPVPQGQNVPEAFLIKPRANDAVTKDGRPYRVVDHWALRDWKWQTEGADGQPVLVQGDLLVHPDYVGKLKNMLGKSTLTSPEGIASVTTRPALKLGALAKQTKLSLSGFHLTQEAVHGLGHRVNPANLIELDMKAPEQRALVDHGLQVADPRAAELFGEGLAGGGLVGKIPGLGKVQVAFNDWLFKDYIPRLKMTMALDALERNRKVYSKDIKSGKITDDQLQALTSRQANAAFGELNYRMMGRNPTVQDFLRLTTLAPDFLEARSRFVGQALKPYGREQRMALGLMGATLYVTGRILNQVLDDDPHWDKPFAVYHNGREYRLRTVLGDIQHLVTDPRRFFFNRMSAFTRIATEAMTGKDDRGMNRGFWEQAEDAARWFIPISAETRSDTSHSQAVAGSLGVSSRPYTARTDLYDLVDKWKKNNPDPKIQEQYEQAKQETRPESAYKKLRDYVRKDDGEAALKEYENLRKTHSDKQIWQAFTVKPFTGGLASEHAFHDSLTPEQQKLYHKAIMEQVAEGQKLSEMIRKAPKPAGF